MLLIWLSLCSTLRIRKHLLNFTPMKKPGMNFWSLLAPMTFQHCIISSRIRSTETGAWSSCLRGWRWLLQENTMLETTQTLRLNLLQSSMSLVSSEEETKLRIPEEFHGCSATISLCAYDARRSHTLLYTHNQHGDSPQQPQCTMCDQYPYSQPLPISLPIPAHSHSVYGNSDDVFLWKDDVYM